MENFPQSVSINMQPYSRNGAGSLATAFGPTITSFVQPEPVPNAQDFVLWSFFNTMFGNFFCLGFVALIFSIKVRQKSPPSHHSCAWLGGPACCLPPCQGSLIPSLPGSSCPTPPNPILSRLVPPHLTPSHP
ncbi:IFM5 protein, partial [Circaetus pectoralis]|nr:IFM5 protein [Circaetus pectoralis]